MSNTIFCLFPFVSLYFETSPVLTLQSIGRIMSIDNFTWWCQNWMILIISIILSIQIPWGFQYVHVIKVHNNFAVSKIMSVEVKLFFVNSNISENKNLKIIGIFLESLFNKRTNIIWNFLTKNNMCRIMYGMCQKSVMEKIFGYLERDEPF